MVLNFWPNLRLAVLIAVVLIKKSVYFVYQATSRKNKLHTDLCRQTIVSEIQVRNREFVGVSSIVSNFVDINTHLIISPSRWYDVIKFEIIFFYVLNVIIW